MTIRKFLKWYLILMLTSIVLMVFSLGTLGVVLLFTTFLGAVIVYFKVKCTTCGNNFGVFAERLTIKSLFTNECSDCLKKRRP